MCFFLTQWIVTTLMVTSTVQHVKQRRPLSRPCNMISAKMFAKETNRDTTEAKSVLLATS
jgi:hypothetical protein